MPAETPYESPLSSRYASKEMLHIFSSQYKYTTWRKLWIALAKAQQSLGLPIQNAQIQSMERTLSQIDFALVAQYEKQFHHDVMAHIHAYGDACPEAKGIIHMGATSCYVTDNTDIIQMKEGLKILKAKLIEIIRKLSAHAEHYAHLACLSYTHLQSAQPTTVGKRICMWIQDVLMDLHDIVDKIDNLHFLGVKGATGTQASFVSLLENSPARVMQLEKMVAEEMGFIKILPISGQTYTRKQDMRVFSVLSGIAATAHKFGTDLRLLAHMKEMEEPFGEKQVGSSAMPYKRNPTRSERMCGLARFLMSLQENPIYTAATQWLERSLDDSSNRRLCIPEAFLCADAVLNLFLYLSSNFVIYPKIIEQRLMQELPFFATETILMAAIKKGKDRQAVHETLRRYSMESAKKWKEEGIKDDLLAKIVADPSFGLSQEELQKLLDPAHFVGRAPEQVRDFLQHEVHPILSKYKHIQAFMPDISV
jgi:adenylosuccinate lyase